MVHDEFIRTCLDTRFLVPSFTILAHMMPYPNAALKISPMEHLQFCIIITHAFDYELEIRMMLMLKL